MSRSFLILTTLPQHAVDDLSERTAILAARREDALNARAAEAPADGGGAGPGPVGAPTGRRLFFGWVDSLGHVHVWPGLQRARRAR